MQFKFWIIMIFTLTAISVVHCGLSASQKRMGIQNWAKLVSMDKAAGPRLIDIRSEKDLGVFERTPRNFTVILLVTITPDPNRCPHCISYEENLVAMKAELANRPQHDRPLFFAKVSADACNQCFYKLEAKGIPVIGIIPASDSSGSLKLNEHTMFYGDPAHHTSSLDEMVRWLEQHTGEHLQPTISIIQHVMFYAGLVGTLSLLGYIAKIVVTKMNFTTLFFVVTLFIYAVSLAGLAYNSIHGPPFWGGSPGAIEYFSSGLRQQFVGEGALISLLHIMAAMCFVGLATIIPNIKNSLVQRLCFCVLMLLTIFFLSAIMEAWATKKMPGYSLAIYFPYDHVAPFLNPLLKSLGFIKF